MVESSHTATKSISESTLMQKNHAAQLVLCGQTLSTAAYRLEIISAVLQGSGTVCEHKIFQHVISNDSVVG